VAITHKVFLFWLLYIVVVLVGWGFLFYLGLPQIALSHDHSYLTVVLLGLYLVAEVLSGRQAWFISKENKIADDVIHWFANNKLIDTQIDDRGEVVLIPEHTAENSLQTGYIVPPSAMADHFSLLTVKANAGQRKIRQNTIIEVTADRLYEQASAAEFIAARIVWIGILATILGVIIAFWPMIGAATIDAMKSNIGGFFGGIAIAFIPTAVSFVFKIVLDFNGWIVSRGVQSLIDKIACVSETDVLPVIDHEDL